METTPTMQAAGASRPGRVLRPAIRVSRRTRRVLLVVHVVASGAWIGVDVIVAVLVGTGWLAGDSTVRSLAYRALAHFVVWPMLASGLVCLGSGLLLGLATKWGLLRYWWVGIKLVLNLTLCTLIVTVLQPGMAEVDSHGQALLVGTANDDGIARLFFPPAVSLTCLALATTLAIVKPWGRTPRGRAHLSTLNPSSTKPDLEGDS